MFIGKKKKIKLILHGFKGQNFRAASESRGSTL